MTEVQLTEDDPSVYLELVRERDEAIEMFSRWRKHAGRLRDRNIALTRENLRLRQLLEERAKPSLKRRTKVKAAKQDADS